MTSVLETRQFAPSRAREVAASFDLAHLPPEFYADPYPFYRALREHEPVRRMPDGSWFLTRYDDVLAVYRDPKLFSSDKKKEFGPKYGATPLLEHHTTAWYSTTRRCTLASAARSSARSRSGTSRRWSKGSSRWSIGCSIEWSTSARSI